MKANGWTFACVVIICFVAMAIARQIFPDPPKTENPCTIQLPEYRPEPEEP